MNLSPHQIAILDYIRTPKTCQDVMDRFGYDNRDELINDLIYFDTLLYKTNDEYFTDETEIQATALAISEVDFLKNGYIDKHNTKIVTIVAAAAGVLSFIATVVFGLLELLN